MNQAEMENSLRALLAERAQQAPLNDGLAEQIIGHATSGGATGGSVRQLHRPAIRRRSWTLPLLAVAAVAAVVAGTVGFVMQGSPSADRGHGLAFGKVTRLPAPTRSVPSSTSPTVQSPTSTVAPAGVTYAYLHLDSTETNGATEVQLSAFRADDLTFVGTNIWAMGSATCVKTGVGRCSALVHSTDGVHWSMLSSTPFNVADVNNCTAPCAVHIRFATSKIGYIFGPSMLLMTTDAGRTWKTQPGGALALETLDGNVIKVSGSDGGQCAPGCTYTVQTAPVGSTTWTTVSLPGGYAGDGVTLARSSHFAYLLDTANPAGGADNEQSTLFTSDNDGATWVRRGEVCGQTASSEVDSVGMTGGSDDSIIVTCQPRLASPTARDWVTVSTNGGASFHRGSATLPADDPALVGAGTAQGICVQDGVLYCTHDGGDSFSKAHSGNGDTVDATWLGFENQTDGRALQLGGTASDPSTDLWTTHDGGATWMLTVGIG